MEVEYGEGSIERIISLLCLMIHTSHLQVDVMSHNHFDQPFPVLIKTLVSQLQ